MAYRNILVESPARISIRQEQLIIKTDTEHSVPTEDISALLIESKQSTITAAALSQLGQCGCTVFMCDEKHLPCSVLLPYSQHSRQLQVTQAQLSMSEPLKKQLWKSIVTAKILNQAKCLELLGKEKEAESIAALASKVRSGDTGNVEAIAAAKYFPLLFGKGFTRTQENIRNSALNYGYAIIRGCMARNLAAYGFMPAFGLHHCSSLNAFNLADDMMEPFRPVTDLMTAINFDSADEFTPQSKRQLFNCLNLDILSGGQHHSVSYAIERMVQSLTRSVTGEEAKLILPELCELKQHSYE